MLLRAFFWLNLLAMTALPDFYVFDPAKCAQLHNQILTIVAAGPRGASNRLVNFFAAYEDVEAADPSRQYLSEPLVKFLSQIDVAVADGDNFSDTLSFTPHLAQPHLASFWSYSEWDLEDQYPHAILLYPEAGGDGEGGVFFDMSTNLAVMIIVSAEFPHKDQWQPLEIILQRYLDLFESGKYHVSDYDSNATGCSAEPWVEQDVLATLEQYHALLDAIAARIAGAMVEDKPLVSTDTLTRWNVKGFAYEFLSRAKSPSFTFIAPGITVWNASAFNTLRVEDIGSARDKVATEQEFETVLIFPSDTQVYEGDEMLRFISPVLFHNLAGVYLWGPDTDEMRFILPYPIGQNGFVFFGSSPRDDLDWKWRVRGNDVLYQHGRCPFFRDHFTRLVTLLHSWTIAVEWGDFLVGPNGVEGGMDLYKQADTANPGIDFNVNVCW